MADCVFGCFAFPLEQDFQGKLNLSRCQRALYLPKGWRADVTVRQAELRAVKEVEKLGAKLEVLRFAQAKRLKCREVKLSGAGSLGYVPPCVAELTRLGGWVQASKGRNVEPLLCRFRPIIGVADQVGPIR